MKSILVPYDFSEEAEYAFKFAQELASKAACKLKLVHIIEIPTSQHFNTMGEVNMQDNYIDKIYIADMVEKRKKQMQELDEAHAVKPYISVANYHLVILMLVFPVRLRQSKLIWL